MPLRTELQKVVDSGRKPRVLILGSGGLSIGQAGEFDYSGTQAIKALKESGMEVILVNPNIATVQTNPGLADRVYLYPVESHWVEKVIEKEMPDGLVAGFGGQTALNCAMKLDEQGILAHHGVLNLGTPIETLRLTEDRDLFAERMRQINIPVPPSRAASEIEEACRAAAKIGYPVILRAAFALGGLGSGFASNEEELRKLATTALSVAPQVLIEKSLKGWKEVEYEVMRDSCGNVITICNMENFDPLGIHTGDSIVFAPSQTLSDEEYQTLRNASIRIVSNLGVVGECNVQFALSPGSLEFYVIEVNARLSRSSALASKATGYPIAFIAAQVVLGKDLVEIRNPVTGVTCAFFEPALDYVTVKIPRWDLRKFPGASRELGSAMKSVGEVMAIGRSLPEALQKAVRMVTESGEGLSGAFFAGDREAVLSELNQPTDVRLFAVTEGLRQGITVPELAEASFIDPWALDRIREIIDCEKEIAREVPAAGDLSRISDEAWLRWKRLGFGDEQMAVISSRASGATPTRTRLRARALEIRRARESQGVKPWMKRIDTTAAEYPAPSRYLYLTYHGSAHDELELTPGREAVIVLGAGAYRIGTSVEFDWCAVGCSRKLQESGRRSVIINCNPETVSTDYSSSDRLYFEELTIERVLDVADLEGSREVVASMGGQLANNLASSLELAGLRILGHSASQIAAAEDRGQFSALLDRLGIDQPMWVEARSREEIDQFVVRSGFPVLVRPSFVLSGAAMKVVYDRESLDQCLALAAEASSEYPVVISKFMEGCRELEWDGVALRGEVIYSAISEHVEDAGVHSGDATVVLPPFRVGEPVLRQIREAGARIVRALGLSGPFNIQFLADSQSVKVIECNTRAARTFPFVSKVTGMDLSALAAAALLGRKGELPAGKPMEGEKGLSRVGVKAAMFSFSRILGSDPVLGVEMASTGEVGCLGGTREEALLLALEATGIRAPRKGVLISAGHEKQKAKFLPVLPALMSSGVPVYATPGTAAYFEKNGFKVRTLAWPSETNAGQKDVLEALRAREIDLVINLPKNYKRRELSDGMKVRQSAVQHGFSLITDVEKATGFIEAWTHMLEQVSTVLPI